MRVVPLALLLGVLVAMTVGSCVAVQVQRASRAQLQLLESNRDSYDLNALSDAEHSEAAPQEEQQEEQYDEGVEEDDRSGGLSRQLQQEIGHRNLEGIHVRKPMTMTRCYFWIC